MRFKKIMLLAGLAFPVIAVAFMNLFSGFTVEREVILTPEEFNRPGALLRASDGGYFVLGEFPELWLVKTDADGKLLWKYREPPVENIGTILTSARPAADGGALLCGTRRKIGPVGGLVIRLDKNGHEVSRIDPYIQHPEQVENFIGTTTCSRWGDGFMVSGSARITVPLPDLKAYPNYLSMLYAPHVDGNTVTFTTASLLRLRSDGSVLWQKTKDWRDGRWGLFDNPRSLPNGDMVFFGVGGDFANLGDTHFVEHFRITQVDGDGNILVVAKFPTSELDAACSWISHTEPSDRLRFVCNPQGERLILELGPDFRIMSKTEIVLPDGMGAARTYSMPDGSLIVSGNTQGTIQRFIPTLVEIGPDGSLKAKHEFLGMGEERITDVMPTDRPGEFVTIRPISHGENKVTAITFLRLN
ncbi:MAG: hypothetical protein ACRETW_07985 [Stenotrophobium sp.]